MIAAADEIEEEVVASDDAIVCASGGVELFCNADDAAAIFEYCGKVFWLCAAWEFQASAKPAEADEG